MTVALLIIDMQNDFVKDILNRESTIKNILTLKGLARENDIPVVYTQETHKGGEKEFKRFGQHAIKGTEGWEVIDDLKPEGNDIVIEKTKFSAFFKTNLDSILSEKRIKKVIITGINLNCCVLATALDGFNYDYEVFVVKEAVSLKERRKNFEKPCSEWINTFCGKIISMEEAVKIIK
jgi:nicotinamidase-related amidase